MGNHVSCAYDFEVTRLTEITATIKKLKLRGLLSNINPKIHFFNYSADINPFLHCTTGNIDGFFLNEENKTCQELSEEMTFSRDDVPVSFHHHQIFYFIFYVTAEPISVK